MNDINGIIICLEKTPNILRNLMSSIPAELVKKPRPPKKMTIHEHACHIVDVQPMLTRRFNMFLNEAEPKITPHLPGQTDSPDRLLKMDLDEMLAKFPGYRAELIAQVRQFDEAAWKKTGHHPEYRHYTPHFQLRHALAHDHYHIYAIERLWLTTEEYWGDKIAGRMETLT